MNLCIPDPSGMLHSVSPGEAREHLADVASAQAREPSDYMLGLLANTSLAADPESHFDNELYQPPGYEPAWIPAA